MPTVLQVKTRFKSGGFYPACPDATVADLFVDAYSYVVEKLRLRSGDTLIALSVNTNVYSLPNAIGPVFDAFLETEAGNYTPLLTITESQKEVDYPNWRNETGSPIAVYKTQLTSGNGSAPYLGTYPTPTEASNPTYPRIVLRATQAATMADGDSVASGLLDADAILYRMAYKNSIIDGDGRAGEFKAMLDESMRENQEHVHGMEKAPAMRVTTTIMRNQTRNY